MTVIQTASHCMRHASLHKSMPSHPLRHSALTTCTGSMTHAARSRSRGGLCMYRRRGQTKSAKLRVVFGGKARGHRNRTAFSPQFMQPHFSGLVGISTGKTLCAVFGSCCDQRVRFGYRTHRELFAPARTARDLRHPNRTRPMCGGEVKNT